MLLLDKTLSLLLNPKDSYKYLVRYPITNAAAEKAQVISKEPPNWLPAISNSASSAKYTRYTSWEPAFVSLYCTSFLTSEVNTTKAPCSATYSTLNSYVPENDHFEEFTMLPTLDPKCLAATFYGMKVRTRCCDQKELFSASIST